MSTSTGATLAIETSGTPVASSSRQAPRSAVVPTAPSHWHDRQNRQSAYMALYSYGATTRPHTPYDHYDQLYPTGEGSSAGRLPYDEPLEPQARTTQRLPLVYDPDYVIAMHDFAPQPPTTTCLSFRAGEVIHVLNRDATGWWDGELDGQRGWFPSNYVSTDAAAFAAAAELAGFTVTYAPSSEEHSHSFSSHDPYQRPTSSMGTNASARRPSSRSGDSRTRKPPSTATRSDQSESVLDRRASCPPLMVPMVHALALLQTAVRSNRITHFQPSTACIISCVRSVLSTCDCLNKDAAHLVKYPTLAHQRKKVLAELARLVGQARHASDSPEAKQVIEDSEAKRSMLHDPNWQRELAEMVRLGDLVYQHVKKFLSLAVSCGIELPQDKVFAGAPGLGDMIAATGTMPSKRSGSSRGSSNAGASSSNSPPRKDNIRHARRSSSLSDLRKDRLEGTAEHSQRDEVENHVGAQHPLTSPIPSTGEASTSRAHHQAPSDWSPRTRESTANTYRPNGTGQLRRQRSMSEDIQRQSGASSIEFRTTSSTPPSSLRRHFTTTGASKIPLTFHQVSPAGQAAAPYRKPKYSTSSVSSLSSYESSQLDSGSPTLDPVVVFPSGETSTPQALACLRATHDRLLSVIAAFIGHIHSHSRSSHASSKGHLIEMTRKTVDQVRYLLTLVDAVEENPTICAAKPREMATLKNARVTLYNCTNDIVEGVKDMLSPPSYGVVTEEEEKARALQAATGTLRAGGECVKCVNMCLSTKIGVDPFVINIAAVPGSGPEHAAEVPTGSVTPTSASTQTSTSTSPPRTPKSPPTFRPSHSHSVSQPHTHISHASKYSHTASVGGVTSQRRPQSDISPIRGEAPARRRAEMFDDVPEGTSEVLEDLEATIRLPVAPGQPTSVLPSIGKPQVLEEDKGPSDHLSPISPALPRLIISEASFGHLDATSSRSSGGTTFSKLSLPIHSVQKDSASDYATLSTPDVPESDASSVGTTEDGKRFEYDDDSSTPGPADRPAVSDAFLDSLSPTELERAPSVSSALEEKLVHGDLPATPSAPPEFLDAVYDPRDLLVNDSQQLVAASLEVMTIKLAPLSFTPDRAFVVAFLLTFRMFTTPMQFAEALITRWKAIPPPSWPESERQDWHSKVPFMQIRVARCIKTWIDQYWQYETDDEVLPLLQNLVDLPLPQNADVSLSNIVVVVRSLVYTEIGRAQENESRVMDRTRAAMVQMMPIGQRDGLPSTDMPTPILKRNIHSRLGLTDLDTPITDFDALEIARQLTLIEARLYCDVPAQELVELGKQGAKSSNVKAISTFSTAVTGWVSESILNEQDGKKRSGLLKYFIKLAERCVGLHNYSTMRSILAALDSSTISRLTKTWAHLSTKYKAQMDSMRALTDHAKNYAVYRETLRSTQPPAIPFLGLYLTDLTFCREGNPSTRPSHLDSGRTLINFIKYHRLARIVQDVQRFQTVSYNLQPVPEIQRYLTNLIEKGKSTSDLGELYRRSLILEPRQANDAAPPDNKSSLLGWARN